MLPLRAVLALLACFVMIFCCSSCQLNRQARATEAQTVQAVADEQLKYDDIVDQLDRQVASLELRCAQHPRSWPDLEGLANAYRQRVMLCDNDEDAQLAAQTIERAFAVAPPRSGPFLSRAALNLWLHRVDAVETDLAAAERAILVKDATKARIALLRADVHYHKSEYEPALAGFKEALNYGPSVEALARFADYHWHTGNPQRGRELYAAALEYTDKAEGEQVAWLYLQMGLLEMDCGQYAEAQREFDRAAEALPGWWQPELQSAQLLAAQNRLSDAIAAFNAVAAKQRHPEILDELARLKLKLGERADAEELIAEARRLHDEALASAPAAACGHAIDHWLSFVEDPAEVVRMARLNFAARPTGAAHVKLAEALWLAGQSAEAAEVVETSLASPYRSADLYDVAGRVYESLDNNRRAQELRTALHLAYPHYAGGIERTFTY